MKLKNFLTGLFMSLFSLLLLVPFAFAQAGTAAKDAAAPDTAVLWITIGIVILVLCIIGIICVVWEIWMFADCVKRNFDKRFKWLMIITLVPFGFIFYHFMIKRKDVQSRQKPKEVEQLAYISVIIGFMSFFVFMFLGIISIIIGAIAKKNIQKNNLGGRDLADAGIAFGIISMITQFIFIVAYFLFIIAVIGFAALNADVGDNLTEFDDQGIYGGYSVPAPEIVSVGETKSFALPDGSTDITIKNLSTEMNVAIVDIDGDEYAIIEAQVYSYYDNIWAIFSDYGTEEGKGFVLVTFEMPDEAESDTLK